MDCQEVGHGPVGREFACIPDLKAVVIDMYLDGRDGGVILVDDGIEQGFAQGCLGNGQRLDLLDALVLQFILLIIATRLPTIACGCLTGGRWRSFPRAPSPLC